MQLQSSSSDHFEKATDSSGARNIMRICAVCLTIGLSLLAGSLFMKYRELIRYHHSGWRIAILVAGSVTGFVSFLTLVGAVLTEAWTRRGWSYTTKGSKSTNLFTAVFSGATLVPVALFCWLFTSISERLETDALRTRGVTGSFRIQSERLVPGKDRHYKYAVQVRDNDGAMHELSLRRELKGDLQVGDTVNLLYISANPECFRESR